MKKLIYIIASVVAFCACGHKQASTENATENTYAELGSVPVEQGVVYLVTPEGAVTSTGSQWVGAYKQGTENKLMIYFFGGGVSIDAYSARYGWSQHGDEMFYFDDMSIWQQVAEKCFTTGFGSQDERNPFRNWSVMMLPYTTGDFHIGTGEFVYTGLDSAEHTLYHHGYTNFRKYMEMVMPYAGTPEAIVVSGSSAGGFGTSFLSEDITELFPQTTNFVSCVDASQLYWDQFPATVREVWKAPEHIAARFVSNNPVYDCLTTLHRDKPYVKILFGCSSRDAALAEFQNYFDKGVKSKPTKEDADVLEGRIAHFVSELLKADPEAGIFIWNDVVTDEEAQLTQHTIETGELFLGDRSGNGSFAQWMYDATHGNVRVVGLDIFKEIDCK